MSEHCQITVHNIFSFMRRPSGMILVSCDLKLHYRYTNFLGLISDGAMKIARTKQPAVDSFLKLKLIFSCGKRFTFLDLLLLINQKYANLTQNCPPFWWTVVKIDL